MSDADADTTGGEPPLAPYSEPELLAVAEWLVGVVDPDFADPLIEDVETGSFAYPGAGTDHRGIRWRVVTPGESGAIGPAGYIILYVVVRLVFEEPTHLVARVDRAWDVYLDGAPQPADVYGSQKMRVPFFAGPGEHVLVVRGIPLYGPFQVQIFTTPDEAYLNTLDLTIPDLVAGLDAAFYLGAPVLNMTAAPLEGLVARVMENDYFEETSVEHPPVAAGAVTQIGFLLRPKPSALQAGTPAPAVLRVVSTSLDWSYEREVEVPVVAGEGAYRRTFLDPTDGSIQYYGVLPPSSFDPSRDYALVLTLHGAGVEAIGQAQAYSPKDWAYIVAPTNRRPFGFDWEEWGRLNALRALDDATSAFRVDPAQVYLTGHSMGGHGTWHVGVTTPGRFAVLGPSAGWSSFYSYTGYPRPSGPFARARAHSDTLVYLPNIARRGVYIIHGGADDNVPVREGRDMYAAVQEVTDDVVYHEEPGAGHWWDGDASPGADCVDWPPLFEFFQSHLLDPCELDFTFRTPSPAYSPFHSFVTLHSALTPYEDLVLTSSAFGVSVEVTTQNVRSLEIDGSALRGRGIETVVVDGAPRAVPDGPIFVGPEEGKRRDAGGPFNQVFHAPFCFVYPDGGGPYARAAAYWASTWTIYGNGHSCALPAGALTDELRSLRNLVYMGLSTEEIGEPDVPFTWDEEAIFIESERNWRSALLFVFPQGERLSAALVSTAGQEHYLNQVVPFNSRSGWPDYMLWTEGRITAAGFFDADWRYDPSLRAP